MSTINPEKLIFLRKEAGLTAEALADAAHVGRATITRIENGKAGATRTETVVSGVWLPRFLHFSDCGTRFV